MTGELDEGVLYGGCYLQVILEGKNSLSGGEL